MKLFLGEQQDMSGLEQVTSSVEDILIDSLQFKPNPSASYITSRKDTRWYQAGSDSYSSDSGVKVIDGASPALSASSWIPSRFVFLWT